MKYLRGALALLLSVVLCIPAPMALAQPAPADRAASEPPARAPYRSNELHGNARILQALNRFTFGPRPGELQAVRAEGLNKWFNQQLHPQSIDETALYARLREYPAMQLSVRNLVHRFPSNAVIRMAMKGSVPIPQDPALHAIYENQIYRMEMRQQGKTNHRREPGRMNRTARHSQTSPTDESIIRSILALPPQQRVDRLVSIREPEFDAVIKSMRPRQHAKLLAGLSPEQRQTVEALQNPERVVVNELMSQRLMCDIYSNAQILEVMTDFWLNHFNIYLRKNPVMPYYLVSYERDTIRPYALGKFEDLLEAVAHSPAMLLYLDNTSSVGPRSIAARRFKRNAWRRSNKRRVDPPNINENYGRELMELHTVGVNAGYTQADVIQAARILTGWTVDRPQLGGGFVFNPNRHEPGTEKVMGYKFKQKGEAQGEAFLHMLATQPATARFISRELAVRFVSDNPPQLLVNRMADTYLATGGDISAVLTTLFHSPEFWARSDYHAKVKTPLEYVVSAARASDANVTNYMPLVNTLRKMGMPLFGCVQPNGYSWKSSAWLNSGDLVDRMNFAMALASNRLPGIRIDWARLTNFAATDRLPRPAAEEARLQPLLLPGGISPSTRTAALEAFQRRNAAAARPVSDVRRFPRRRLPNLRARQTQLLAGLLIGSPDFQRR